MGNVVNLKRVNYSIKKKGDGTYEKETGGIDVSGCAVLTVSRNGIWSRFFGWNRSRSVW